MIKKLGGKTDAGTCSADNSSAAPLFDPDFCTYLDNQDQFECLEQPEPSNENRQRLCYCQFLKGVYVL